MSKIILTSEQGQMNAEIIKNFLESNGINASYAAQDPGRYGSQPAISFYEIYVEDTDLEMAKKILESRN